MAFNSSYLCCSPCQNFPPIDHIKNELAKDLDSSKGPNSSDISSALSYNPTPDPASTLVLVFTLASASTFSNKFFKQFMEAYLESNQQPN